MVDDTRPIPWSALAERLPTLLEAQFANYRRLAAIEPVGDDSPRELTAWENARKAALAHLQSLIRVHDLVQARLSLQADDNELDVRRLLAEVRLDLAGEPATDSDAEADE